MRKTGAILAFLLIGQISLFGQNIFEFKGQASVFGNYSPDNDLDFFTGGRYIPEMNYKIKLPKSQNLDFVGAANMYANSMFHAFDTSVNDATIKPYRVWARYTGKQIEVRAGLQKIDFGSATILRPLQWFNQIDPRDPLSQTNGVYGLLGRYYFLNNANIWLWMLYGNEEIRGFDAIKTYGKQPEFGGRLQYPVTKGEIAISYHHRAANSTELPILQSYEKNPEDRLGLDGKWDVGIGLWFEASYIQQSKDIGAFTNQGLFNLGCDYTFGVGNGLNVITEHLFFGYDEEPFQFGKNSNITAATLSYPLNFFNNLSSVLYYSWETEDFAFFLNFEHQFQHFTGYLMAYYNPEQQAFQQNDMMNSFAGPGIRLMLVYNHLFTHKKDDKQTPEL